MCRLTRVFRNSLRELGVRQLKQNRAQEAVESFALSGLGRADTLLKAGFDRFELEWSLLGFRDTSIAALLEQGLAARAVDALILLGDAPQAMHVAQTSGRTGRQFRDQLRAIGKLCQDQSRTDLFLQTQALLGNRADVVEYLLRHGLGERLARFIRDNDFKLEDTPLLQTALDYFETRDDSRAAWQVLLKLGDRRLMVAWALRRGSFTDALRLLRESRHLLECPALALRLTQHLVSRHRFREAFDVHRKVGRAGEFEAVMKDYVKLQFARRDHSRVAKGLRFLFQQLRRPIHLRLLRYFEVLSRVRAEMAVVKSALTRLPGSGSEPAWSACFTEYFSGETFRIGGNHYTRLGLVTQKLSFLMRAKDITENEIFRGVKHQLSAYSTLVKSVSATANLADVSIPSADDKENRAAPLGSKARFKKLMRARHKPSKAACFLCRSLQHDGLGSHCRECRLRYTFCAVSGVQVPIVQFAMQPETGRNLCLRKPV